MTTNDPDPTLPYQSLPLEPPPRTPEPPDKPHDPYAALRVVNFRRYFVGNAFSTFGVQMAGVTVGWELYARSNSASLWAWSVLSRSFPLSRWRFPPEI